MYELNLIVIDDYYSRNVIGQVKNEGDTIFKPKGKYDVDWDSSKELMEYSWSHCNGASSEYWNPRLDREIYYVGVEVYEYPDTLLGYIKFKLDTVGGEVLLLDTVLVKSDTVVIK